jgi:hypothetical protein
MGAKVIGQLAIDEEVREDADLEAALEARWAAKLDLADCRATYDVADEKAKAELERMELADGQVIRIGRFRIEKKFRPARHVEFDSRASSAISIEPDKGEEFVTPSDE